MQCQEFVAYSPEWLEGERSPAALAHRSACPRCSALIADLEAIRAAAAALGAASPEPPARLWAALREQLEAEGIIRPRQSLFERLFGGLPALPRPALAGAYAAMLAAAALLIGYRAEAPLANLASAVAPAPPALALMPAQLETVKQKTIWSVHTHDPAIAASYRENLAIVDNFIDVCEKKVSEDPQNDLARDYLMTAYQEKADLLASMMERGAHGD